MNSIHREVLRQQDTRNGRECQFCRSFDADFSSRLPTDRLVHANVSDSASSHLTENGHVRHRMLELKLAMQLKNNSAPAA